MKAYGHQSFFSVQILILLGFLLGAVGLSEVHATHIVGGEMTYRCLGDNQFELRLTIYRDCFNGVPYFDDPARVAVYDGDGQLVDSLFMPFLMIDDTLDPSLEDTCLSIPPDVCVHTTFYVDTIELPPIPGGYFIAYQRCCRNYSIANVPQFTGATYGVEISEEAILTCNSSPNFKNWPPIFICVDKPLEFDHSAIDAEGDSIVYRLCTPFNGADQFDPLPEPGEQTPIVPVTWVPPYGLDNMMGGVPLAVDTVTGLMTAVPNTIGQFVVGVCMEEYRDGKLLSVVRRDFQYNIGICGEPTSAFFAPDTSCSKTVQFIDNSTEATTYEWRFKGPGLDSVILDQPSPQLFFPEFATYEVTLIVNPGSVCTDSLTRNITIVPNSLTPGFEILPLPQCQDSVLLQVINTSEDTLVDILGYNWWITTDFQDTVAFSQDATITQWFSGVEDTFILRLTLTNELGCQAGLNEEFAVTTWQDITPDTLIEICEGFPVIYTAGNLSDYVFSWGPDSLIADPADPEQLLNPVSDATYFVTVTDPSVSDTCQIVRQIQVIVNPVPSPSFTVEDLPPCADSIVLTANNTTLDTFGGLEYQWILNEFSAPFGVEDTTTDFTYTLVDVDNIFFLTLVATTPEGCVNGFSTVQDLTTWTALPEDTTLNICRGQPQGLNPDGNPDYSYQWSPSQGLSSDTVFNPLANPLDTTIYSVTITRQDGAEECVRILEVQANVLDVPDIGATGDTAICKTDTVLLSGVGDSSLTYEWSLSFGFNEILDTGQVLAAVPPKGGVTFFYVRAGTGNGCYDTEVVQVNNQSINLFFPEVQFCTGDTFLVDVPNLNFFQNVQYTWSASPEVTLLQTAGSEALITADSSGLLYLNTLNDAGCTRSDSLPIQIGFPFPVQETGGGIICADTLPRLAVSSNPGASYRWALTPDFSFVISGDSFLFLNSPPGLPVPTFYEVDHGNGCVSRDSMQVLNAFSPRTWEGSTSICGSDTLPVYLVSTNLDIGYELLWDTLPYTLGPYDQDALQVYPPFSTSFSVTLLNEFGCRYEDEVPFTVEAFSDIYPDTLFEICRGQALSLNTGGNPDYNYLWGPDSLFADPTQVNPTVSPDQTTQYTLQLQEFNSPDSCASTRRITVVVVDPPEVSFSVDSLPFCQDTVVLNAFNTTIDTFQSGLVYEWSLVRDDSLNPIIVQNTEDFSFSIMNVSDTLQLFLTASLNSGCSSFSQEAVPIRTWVDVFSDTSLILCEGDTLALNPGGNSDYTYTWTPSDGLSSTTAVNPLVSPNDTTVYTATLLDAFDMQQCETERSVAVAVVPVFPIQLPEDTLLCEADSVPLTAFSQNYSMLEWSTSPDFSTVLSMDTTVHVLPLAGDTGVYFVRVAFAENCLSEAFTQVVHQSIQLDIPPVEICLGDTARLAAFSTIPQQDVTYQWTAPLPFLTGNTGSEVQLLTSDSLLVALSTSNPFGCSREDTIPVLVGRPFPITLSGDTSTCADTALFWRVSSPVATGFLWSESSDFNQVVGQSDTLLYALEPRVIQPLYVRVDHGNGCLSDTSILLENRGSLLDIQGADLVCGRDTTYISITNLSPEIPIDILWMDDPTAQGPFDNDSLQVFPNTSQSYFVTVNNNLGCRYELEVPVNVALQSPQLSIFAAPDTILLGESSELTAQTDADNPNFQWDPDSTLSNLDIADPVATPDRTTVYTLLVTDENGCVAVRTVTVVVVTPPCIDPYIFFPNVFTPNGDGRNDELQVYGPHIEESYWVIYNRWGEEIFESNRPDEHWDGTYKGESLSEDVFGYYLRVRCIGGETMEQKGNVTLMR